MKFAISYALQRGDLVLFNELRRNFVTMKPRKFLMIDEHYAL